jgi:hypothetical protein
MVPLDQWMDQFKPRRPPFWPVEMPEKAFCQLMRQSCPRALNFDFPAPFL